MLTRAQKEEQIVELQEKFARATGVFLVDYRGISVQAINELRASLKKDQEQQVEYRVIKNAVLRRAAQGTDLAALEDLLVGPTAVAISYADPAQLAKTLVNYSKQHEVFELKGATLDGNVLDQDEIAKLATLPSLLELRGQLAGLLLAPATKLVRLFVEPASQLARLADARGSALAESGDT